jgi:hypothetical protein
MNPQEQATMGSRYNSSVEKSSRTCCKHHKVLRYKELYDAV